MTNNTIFNRLKKYLPEVHVRELEITCAAKGCIVLCMTINNIIRIYSSTQEDEDTVSKLLYELCKNYFK